MKTFSELEGKVSTVNIQRVLPSEEGWVVLKVISRDIARDLLDEYPVPANFETLEEFKKSVAPIYEGRVHFELCAPSKSSSLRDEDDLFKAKLQFLGAKPVKDAIPEIPFSAFIQCYFIDETDGWKVRMPDGSCPGVALKDGYRIATEADLKKVLAPKAPLKKAFAMSM